MSSVRGLLVALALAGLPGSAAVAVTASPSAEPAPAQEALPVEGAGSPDDAPLIGTGYYIDLLRQPETLWYGLEAGAGQQVAVTAVVRGRLGGPSSDATQLRVQLLDAQRQPVSESVTDRFTGTVDARVELVGDPFPAITAGAGPAYLTVTLADPTGRVDLAELGYQLEFALVVSGEAVTAAPVATPNANPTAAPSADPAATAPPVVTIPAAPTSPGRTRDLLPIGLVALALGGALGFEASRRRR